MLFIRMKNRIKFKIKSNSIKNIYSEKFMNNNDSDLSIFLIYKFKRRRIITYNFCLNLICKLN